MFAQWLNRTSQWCFGITIADLSETPAAELSETVFIASQAPERIAVESGLGSPGRLSTDQLASVVVPTMRAEDGRTRSIRPVGCQGALCIVKL